MTTPGDTTMATLKEVEQLMKEQAQNRSLISAGEIVNKAMVLQRALATGIFQ